MLEKKKKRLKRMLVIGGIVIGILIGLYFSPYLHIMGGAFF